MIFNLKLYIQLEVFWKQYYTNQSVDKEGETKKDPPSHHELPILKGELLYQHPLLNTVQIVMHIV